VEIAVLACERVATEARPGTLFTLQHKSEVDMTLISWRQLILDECTNFLDINSVIWLQTYLNSLSCTILAVAHDRDFLDSTTTSTIFIRDHQLVYLDSCLSEAERTMKQQRKALLKVQASMDRKREKIEQSIEEGKRAAKKVDDEGRYRMIKSRQKKLDDRWGMDKNEKGHR
jgi:ATP-binding cassette, subfamily F, member 3